MPISPFGSGSWRNAAYTSFVTANATGIERGSAYTSTAAAVAPEFYGFSYVGETLLQ